MMLTDDQADRFRLPTRRNILKGFDWLMRDLKSGDSLFFYFSGAHCEAGCVSASSARCMLVTRTLLAADGKPSPLPEGSFAAQATAAQSGTLLARSPAATTRPSAPATMRPTPRAASRTR